MYHLGTGNPWDLARKTDGLYILPPFTAETMGAPRGRIENIYSIMEFLTHSNQEYVLMCDCNEVSNIDVQKLFDHYTEADADILICYRHGTMPKNLNNTLAFNVDESKRIVDAVVSPKLDGRVQLFSERIHHKEIAACEPCKRCDEPQLLIL